MVNCAKVEFHNFGATQLKALPPKELILNFGTDNRSAEDDLKERKGVYKWRRSER